MTDRDAQDKIHDLAECATLVSALQNEHERAKRYLRDAERYKRERDEAISVLCERFRWHGEIHEPGCTPNHGRKCECRWKELNERTRVVLRREEEGK